MTYSLHIHSVLKLSNKVSSYTICLYINKDPPFLCIILNHFAGSKFCYICLNKQGTCKDLQGSLYFPVYPFSHIISSFSPPGNTHVLFPFPTSFSPSCLSPSFSFICFPRLFYKAMQMSWLLMKAISVPFTTRKGESNIQKWEQKAWSVGVLSTFLLKR